MDVLRFKQANCKNCYKCVRFCPVKSIRVYQGHAQIISSDCILCGNCVSVCPQHAKEDISDVGQIRELIASGKQVVVSVDSSYIAYFDTPGFQGIEKPLKALGFTAAHETAEGAYLVKKELEKLADHHLGLFDDRALCGKASAGGAAVSRSGALADAGACRAAA